MGMRLYQLDYLGPSDAKIMLSVLSLVIWGILLEVFKQAQNIIIKIPILMR
jgi:hypothetical protein